MTWLNGLALSPHLQVVFIAHGFIESGLTPWVGLMVKSLLRTQPLSKGLHRIEDNPEEEEAVVVVVVDWRVGAQSPYAQAVANARLVGAMTGHLIMRMQAIIDLRQEVLSLNGSSFHLVGHSLGSHLMGYAGSYTSTFGDKPSLVGRITALDPAGPFFRNVDPLVRLDPSDAEYVDVIHTDSNEILPGIPMSLGNPDPLGHVDFYPNGGSQQPGCSSSLGEELVLNQRDLKTGLLDFMGTMFLAPGSSRSIVTALDDIGRLQALVVEFAAPDDLLQSFLLWRFQSPVVHLSSLVVEFLATGEK
ncbi:hypothetical protein HAZT_HAZT011520 [Hyalella azteca]|uniref:Lipase domain-containing protein n=1 Tax=Hyalella azteca TaxID=294128 RepID=A0A6A0H5S3_HYAAZ|nr:hypothetical protein HAZT_HAZT011520 [Hyalella azteca]